MRIVVTPAGEVQIDTDDAKEAAALIAALRNGASTPRKKTSRAAAAPEVALSAVLAETWNWLVANDSAGGLAPVEVAAGLGIKHHAAVWRIAELVKKGVAYRASLGHYRAGEGR